MSEQIENFEYVQMSCYLYSTSLTEIGYLYKSRPEKERDIISMRPFQFYMISLTYMMTMELMKLLEPDTKETKGKKWENHEDTNFASLSKLNRTASKSVGRDFNGRYEENKKILAEIRAGKFYEMAKEKRDRKLAHTDRRNGNPYGIRLYTPEEIEEAKIIRDKIKSVLDSCTNGYGDYQFIFDHEDNRTDNFIISTARENEFFHKNIMQALNEGFLFNQGNNG
ncbi:hypothetical protein [Echinicola rosea]|uniref:HEPN AbiU2-like domain-containing protein n=1 Tax=Echinicola rosea TaxID=1807691 RepID=A0ABQ1VB16_9BACT|nr:hypothetical protein [Echinicola rosea]GGF49083.1 hypothetical protein GCM10011339_42130 [Echinicola rosea]